MRTVSFAALLVGLALSAANAADAPAPGDAPHEGGEITTVMDAIAAARRGCGEHLPTTIRLSAHRDGDKWIVAAAEPGMTVRVEVAADTGAVKVCRVAMSKF